MLAMSPKVPKTLAARMPSPVRDYIKEQEARERIALAIVNSGRKARNEKPLGKLYDN
jgi:hypothetical protein